MSWTSPRTVARTIVPLPASVVFSMWGSSRATAAFITSADCNTKGNCISPLAKRCPTTCIPAKRCWLMISSAERPPSLAKSRSGSKPFDSPSMIRRSSRSVTGSASSSALRWSLSAAESTPSNNSSIRASGSYVTLPSASYSRLSQIKSSATCRCSSGIVAKGIIFAASMMAVSSPAAVASLKKTEFSTARDAGFRPKDTLETPRVV